MRTAYKKIEKREREGKGKESEEGGGEEKRRGEEIEKGKKFKGPDS